MTVIAHTIARPLQGKRQAAELRIKQAGGIYARHGATVKVTRMVAGPEAGCLGLIRGYPDFATAAAVLQAVNSDPAYADFQREQEANPLAEIVSGRNVSRRVFGEGKWSTHPVSLLRHYDMQRDQLPDALALLAEVAELVSANDVNVLGLVPITGDHMSSMTVSYQFRSIGHWGEAMDAVGTSQEMQALIARACAHGTLRSASVMAPL